LSDRIYPIELEIKDTTDTDLDIHLKIDSEERLRTKFCDERDDFNFSIVNFPFICSNILVMHGEESQVPGDLRQFEILIEQDFKI
jgi:hypothetical protein